ncbi:von Willebrand factor type A domain-containing protein [Microbulbifer donghaiensis]|uniref:von Willebrand factor type A domain-containing protein n=1 Tax=Microbulbifer donghaiensis TaxID=494016 RepID=A0A1M4Z196_9GAMM|nr:VWA domain-containing protein [Microbulbifer donghaiensis]SHF11760.1 von Willebrand factor type A domain-containing protein [Microbulbifer donghaiensis]
MNNPIKHLIVLAGAVLLVACGEPVARNQGVYMLIDTSGTYTQELDKAQQVINYTLAKMNPGDTFAVASINTGSFSEKNIKAKVTFDDRPSVTNRQKQAFQQSIQQFVDETQPAAFTDITGGLLQAVEYLNEKEPGRKTILIFSDLKEELKEGYNRDVPLQLDGFSLVALNVTKLRSDNLDPNEYLGRLQQWQSRVEASGGSWRVVNDLERLEKVLP